MELKDFISETLSQLIDGVLDAQSKVQKPGDTGGRICPHVRNPDTKSIYGITNDHLPVIFVDFDVSIIAEEGKGSKAGIGVVAGMFGLGAQGQSNESSQTSNKIKFKIPVALPLQPYIKNEPS